MRFAQPETWFQHPTIFGAVLGILTLSVAFLLPRDAAIQFAAITLAVTGGAYAGFALQDSRSRILWVEMLGALAFAAASLAGLWITPFAIPAAYILHAVWDMLHHRGRVISTGVPGWYIPFCIVFDLLTASGLLALWL